MDEDLNWFERCWFGRALSALREFYKGKDALLQTQTFILTMFHGFVLFALMIGRSEPSREPPISAVGRGIVLRADDPIWGVAHALVVVLSILGATLRRKSFTAIAFTISSFVWLVWGILLAAWTAMTPEFAITLSGMIILVLLPMSAVVAWIWTEREE